MVHYRALTPIPHSLGCGYWCCRSLRRTPPGFPLHDLLLASPASGAWIQQQWTPPLVPLCRLPLRHTTTTWVGAGLRHRSSVFGSARRMPQLLLASLHTSACLSGTATLHHGSALPAATTCVHATFSTPGTTNLLSTCCVRTSVPTGCCLRSVRFRFHTCACHAVFACGYDLVLPPFVLPPFYTTARAWLQDSLLLVYTTVLVSTVSASLDGQVYRRSGSWVRKFSAFAFFGSYFRCAAVPPLGCLPYFRLVTWFAVLLPHKFCSTTVLLPLHS